MFPQQLTPSPFTPMLAQSPSFVQPGTPCHMAFT